MSSSDTTKKKTRTTRSPEKIAELILEAERTRPEEKIKTCTLRLFSRLSGK